MNGVATPPATGGCGINGNELRLEQPFCCIGTSLELKKYHYFSLNLPNSFHFKNINVIYDIVDDTNFVEPS